MLSPYSSSSSSPICDIPQRADNPLIKIHTLFLRNDALPGHPVIDVVTPGCEWVLAGEGTATRKLDGMNVKVEGGELFKRHKPKDGARYDEASYVPCSRDNRADVHLYRAFDATAAFELAPPKDGIYEALGPQIQGGVDAYSISPGLVGVVPFDVGLDIAWLQGGLPGAVLERTFLGLQRFLASHRFEGIVFHHPDGRMAKIKRRDFGLPWPAAAVADAPEAHVFD